MEYLNLDYELGQEKEDENKEQMEEENEEEILGE
jgi:hypothetical protein